MLQAIFSPFIVVRSVCRALVEFQSSRKDQNLVFLLRIRTSFSRRICRIVSWLMEGTILFFIAYSSNSFSAHRFTGTLCARGGSNASLTIISLYDLLILGFGPPRYTCRKDSKPNLLNI